MDYKEAEKLLRSGKSQAEVAERMGVSPSAISVAIGRGNIKHDSGYQRRLPWRVKKEHSNLSVPRALRLALRLRAGEELDPQYQRLARGFLNRLDEMDAVIHYDPDVAPFFFRVPRRPGIDKGLFREPEH